jgi:hypothetical protein
MPRLLAKPTGAFTGTQGKIQLSAGGGEVDRDNRRQIPYLSRRPNSLTIADKRCARTLLFSSSLAAVESVFF